MGQVYIYVLTLIAMLFSASLAWRSDYVNKYRNRFFLIAISCNSVICFCEMMAEFSEFYGWRMGNILSHAFTYSLAPFVAYNLVLMNRKKWENFERVLMIPAALVAIATLTTQWTGFIFYVNSENEYRRGNLFYVALAVSFGYFAYMVVLSYREYRDTDRHEKVYLMCIFLAVVSGVVAQIMDSDLRTMWPSVGIGMLLYYVFSLESSSKYDMLTGVRNSNAYNRAKESLTIHKDYAIIVFDINDLKMVNDLHGHYKGDQLIMSCASVIMNAFLGAGRLFRIGGDEFVLIMTELPADYELKKRFYVMEQGLKRASKMLDVPVSVSYGYDYHREGEFFTYMELFQKTDAKMYVMKREHHKNRQIVGE